MNVGRNKHISSEYLQSVKHKQKCLHSAPSLAFNFVGKPGLKLPLLLFPNISRGDLRSDHACFQLGSNLIVFRKEGPNMTMMEPYPNPLPKPQHLSQVSEHTSQCTKALEVSFLTLFFPCFWFVLAS